MTYPTQIKSECDQLSGIKNNYNVLTSEFKQSLSNLI